MEFLRRTGSPTGARLRTALESAEAATCDPVRLEVLAGARHDAHLDRLDGLLKMAVLLPVGSTDYDEAASLYRACRRRGETPRRLFDCLIAAVAIREDVPLLHADRDFDAIARCTRLEVVSP